MLIFCSISFFSNAATTYFLTAAGAGSAQTPGSWNTVAGGGGAAAPNFTTNGDIFNIPIGISGTFGANTTFGSGSASGSGITVQILGSATINTGVTIILTGKGSNSSSMTVSGTIIFGATSQVQLAVNNAANFFTLTAAGTLKTANTTGILGTNCSIDKSTNTNAVVTLNSANYEFNGAANQATLGLPATVNNLTISNTGAAGNNTVTLGQITTISSNLTVSSGTLDLGAFTANRASAGGIITVSNGATLKIGGTGTFPSNFSTHTLLAASTVEYSGTGQTVTNETYGNLTLSGSGTKTMPAGALAIAGNFTTSGTASATAVAAMTIGGNVTLGSGTTFNGGSFTHNVAGNWSNTSSFAAGTSTINFNGTSLQTITGATTFNVLKINNAAGVTLASPITVSTLTIGDVTSNSIFSDGGNQVTSTGTLNLTSGTFNIGSGASNTSFPAVTTKNIGVTTTVNFNSTASQTIPAVNFGNLTNTGNGARTLANSGTIGIAGAFSPGGGAYTIGGSTISYNGSGLQTITAFNYNNLTVTNAAGNITLANSGTIGIAGTFNPGAGVTSFGTITTSTVSFNGTSGAQAIPAFTFNNLTITNASGISSLGGDVTVNQSLQLNSAIITTGSYSIISPVTGSVSRTTGWINGNLQQYISAAGTTLFPVGSATTYRPVSLNVTSLGTAGFVTATQLAGPQPQLSSSGLDNVTPKTLTPYWKLTSGGFAGTYSPTFTFIAGDVPGGATPTSFVIRSYNGSWTTTTPGSALATSTTATGVTTFGDFAIGQVNTLLVASGALITTNPICIGSTTNVTASSTSLPSPSIQWQRYDNTSWTDITASNLDGPTVSYSNYTTGTLTITNATAAINSYQYRAVFTNINGSVTSAAGTLTVTTPSSGTFNYPNTPFGSTDASTQLPDLSLIVSGTTGTFSAPGLTFVSTSTGGIKPSANSVGTYTVTYTIPTFGGCPSYAPTTSVTITLAPTADINYLGSPYCKSLSTAQAVTITGTGAYTPGSYTYTGSGTLSLDGTTGAITPSTSTAGTYTVTYHIPAASPYPASTTTTTVTITDIPTASINYAGGPFCTSDGLANPVTLTGTGVFSGGTYGSSPAGLSLDVTTGDITPSLSTGGITYTITYTGVASGGCAAPVATTTTAIVSRPAATLSYALGFYCQAFTTPQPATLSGASGGTFSYTSASGTGTLSLNTSTGAITPSASTPDDYTVIYTIPASGPCGVVQVTADITIVESPAGTIDYAGQPYCASGGARSVTLTGTGLYTGGTYSYTTSPGLSLNTTTGDISPVSSTAGSYIVSYATPNCPITFTTNVDITAAPSANISYAGAPYCQSDGALKSVTLTGDLTGSFSAPAGLSIDGSTGAITPSTSTAGAYTVTYTIPAAGTCSDVFITTPTPVTITGLPTATISYAGTPYCSTITSFQSVTLSGTFGYAAGTYSAPGGLTINASGGSAGAIKPSTSTAGTYLVTYTIPAAGGCAQVQATTSTTITALPTATISYPGPFCISDLASYPVTLSGTGAYNGGTYASSPGGLSMDASGTVSPSLSTANTYSVTYTVPASSGCAAVPANTSVTINPLPVITSAATGFACSGSAQSYTIATSPSGSTYSWDRPVVGGISEGAVAGQTSNPITEALTNTTTLPVDVIYTITPTRNGCTGSSSTYTATVNPKSTAPTSVTSDAVANTICNGGSTILILNGGTPVSGSVIKWYTGSCGSVLAGTGNGLSVSPTSTTVYYGRYEDGAPCNTVTACASITINVNQISADPTSATTSAASNTICAGGNTILTLNGGGGGTSATIHWYSGSCGGTPVGTGNNISVSPATTTTYYGRYEDASPCSVNSNCASVTVTVNTISTNPTSATTSAAANTICTAGSTTLTLSGGTLGTGAVVKWYTGSCGGTLVGTGNGLSVSPASTTTYFGRYEDPAPCNSLTSCVSVTVTVNTKSTNPTTATSSAGTSICSGSGTNLSLSGGTMGTGATVVWYSGSCGGTLVGSGNPLAVTLPGTITYYGRYEDPAPCSSTTTCATVAITAGTPPTANAGTAVSLCGNSAQATPSGSTSINVTAGASVTNALSVSWSSSGIGTWTNQTSLTLATYTPSAADKTAGSVTITLTAFATAPCTGSVTSSKTLTLGKTITNNNITLVSECKSGTNTAQILIDQLAPAISGGDGTFLYTWQFSTPGNSGPWNNVAGFVNCNCPALSLNQAATNGFYRRVAFSGGCSDTYTGNLGHVNSSNVISPVSYAITGGGAYCQGGAGVPMGLSGSDGGTIYIVTYSLWRDGVYTGISVVGNGSAISFGNQTIAGVYTVKQQISVPGGVTCAATDLITGSVTVSIDLPAGGTTVGANQAFCYPTSSATLTGSVSSPSTSYSWSRISGSGTITSPTNLTTGLTGLATGDNVFRLTNVNGTCSTYTQDVTIRINALPTATISASTPVCQNNASPGITFNGASGSGAYTFTYTDYNAATQTASGAPSVTIAGPSTAAANSFTYTLVSVSDNNTGCSQLQSGSSTVTVNPLPVIGNQAAATSCSNQSISPTITGTLIPAGTTYTWPLPSLSAGLSGGVAGTDQAFATGVLINSTSAKQTATYTITPKSGAGCTGASFTLVVNVDPSTATQAVWTGTISSDWCNTANWACGLLPDQVTNALIPSGTTYGPDANCVNVYVKDLTVQPGATLTITTAINIYGAFTNTDPTRYTLNGTVNFAGVNQTIPAFTYMGVTVSGGGTKTLAGAVTVNGSLTLINGVVDATSNMLTIGVPGSMTAGSSTSYVIGAVTRETNTAGILRFSVGGTVNGVNDIHAVELDVLSGGFSSYTVYYHPAATSPLIGGLNLFGVEAKEYWDVQRNAGSDAIPSFEYKNPNALAADAVNTDWTSNMNPCTFCNVAVTEFNGLWYYSGDPALTNAGVGWTPTESTFWQSNGFVAARLPLTASYTASTYSFGFGYLIVLAVKLETFTGTPQGNNALLEWKFAPGSEMASVELQHSTNGRNFSKLVDKPATANTSVYNYVHANLPAGANYYRLKIRDKSGKETYSKTVLLVMGTQVTIIKGLRPTMVQATAFADVYSVKAQGIRFSIFDIAGRITGEQKAQLQQGDNAVKLNLQMLAQGTYTIQVRTDDGVLGNLRFVKQ